MVMNLDFAETILDMTGVKIPSGMQGKSFVPILKGKQKNNFRDAVYYHFYENEEHKVAKHIGVRTNSYKLIYFYEKDDWELYDLEKDRSEMNNVYNDPGYTRVREMMIKKLHEVKEKYKDPIVIKPPGKQAMWKRAFLYFFILRPSADFSLCSKWQGSVLIDSTILLLDVLFDPNFPLGPESAEYLRNKNNLTDIGERLKDPNDEMKL